MCLAVPAKIVRMTEEGKAIAEVGGVGRAISLALVEDAKVGDYVIVHVGFALSKLDPEEAAETLRLFGEWESAGAQEGAVGKDRAAKTGADI